MLVVFVVLAIGFGFWDDIDYCANTSARISTLRFFGIPIKVERGSGYRDWLEDDLGIYLPEDYVNYISCPMLFPVALTPPGNWLSLRNTKRLYDKYPDKRELIKNYLKKLENRPSARLTYEDHVELNNIVYGRKQNNKK
jgi:hypothetical protein